MFSETKCFCSSTISGRQQGNQDRLHFPSASKTRTNMLKMKENVTDWESRVWLEPAQKIYSFFTKCFPWEKKSTYVQFYHKWNTNPHIIINTTQSHTHSNRGIDSCVSAGTTIRRLHMLRAMLSVVWMLESCNLWFLSLSISISSCQWKKAVSCLKFLLLVHHFHHIGFLIWPISRVITNIITWPWLTTFWLAVRCVLR